MKKKIGRERRMSEGEKGMEERKLLGKRGVERERMGRVNNWKREAR